MMESIRVGALQRKLAVLVNVVALEEEEQLS